MHGARHRVARRVGSLLLVALLFVPIALRGHRHPGHTTPSAACAACLAAHHTPAASAAGVGAAVPVLVGIGLTRGGPALPAFVARSVSRGRSPPALLSDFA